jgi:hypothetical protein
MLGYVCFLPVKQFEFLDATGGEHVSAIESCID